MAFEDKGLGRRVPTDWSHVEKYSVRRLMPEAPFVVNDALPMVPYRTHYDQGKEGACVGFSLSWMMSILNRRLYDARQLYLSAQKFDEWDDTPPEEGSSVRAGCDVLRAIGHWRIIQGGRKIPANLEEGIAENRWATRVDELRACIAAGIPFVLGINWYSNFQEPEAKRIGKVSHEYWIGKRDLGYVLGGHAICGYAASDRRQAFKLQNTWGDDYPAVWIPYDTVERLLSEDGEACLVTDRVKVLAADGSVNVLAAEG
jgi:hypothetical protein